MPVSADYVTSREYEERVYAGVLGKIIGVYLGRPFEGWSNARIEEQLGEVDYYVHDKLGAPLLVTDDDISGTFTFVRALAENGYDPDLTPAQIGDWWRNTIIENRTILWWGGLGMSTEHTAFLRLKAGLKAPDSGSIATNGKIVAEQIGAQIFIDGWGLICPGDPERAAEFALRAASVSHDGEAVYGAQVVAALEAAAFTEPDLNTLLDTAAALIPADSTVRRLIGDLRGWAADHGDDWRATLRQIQAHYGYDKFGGNCHMVPNHALILLGLLHGRGEFQRSLMITNTAGWDTDCNSGNVGCLLGVWKGLAALENGPDWRGPVADRLYLPTADGGHAISDALRETFALVDAARTLAGQPPAAPKDGARFHFSLPGSVQGFTLIDGSGEPRWRMSRRLSLCLPAGGSARIGTPTFTPPEALHMTGYGLVASPTLYAGQTITAQVQAASDAAPARVCLSVGVYHSQDTLTHQDGPWQTVQPGQTQTLSWTVPDTKGQPVGEVGLQAAADQVTTVKLDWLTWSGSPQVTLGRPGNGGTVWERAWINAVTHFSTGWVSSGLTYRLIQDEGTGLISQGEASWSDYTVSTKVQTHLARRTGLLACVQGLHRYVALLLDHDGHIRLIQQRDDDLRILAESSRRWTYEERLPLEITVSTDGLRARVGDDILTASGPNPSWHGAVGLLVDTGHAEFSAVEVRG